MKKQRIVLTVGLLLVFILGTATIAFGAVSDPGVALGNWLVRNVQGVFIGIVAIVGVVLFISRKMMALVITLVFAGVSAIFIFGGVAFAQKLSNVIQSWF